MESNIKKEIIEEVKKMSYEKLLLLRYLLIEFEIENKTLLEISEQNR